MPASERLKKKIEQEKDPEGFRTIREGQPLPGDLAGDPKISNTADRAIRFNPDGTVTVQEKGSAAQTLTKEEYNSLNPSRAGFNSIQSGEVATLKAQQANRLGTIGQTKDVRSEQARITSEEAFAQLQELNRQREEIIKQLEVPNAAPFLGDSVGGAVGAGLTTGILGGAAAGGAAGAVAGSLAGGVGALPGAAIGAVGGAITGGVKSVITTIPGEKKQQAQEAYVNYTTSKQNMNKILSLANSGEISRAEAIARWKKEKQDILTAQAKLKYLTSSDLQKYLSDGKDEQIKVENFIDSFNDLDTELALALSNPDPNRKNSFFYEEDEL